jgi:hypothetical protein
MVMNNLPEHNYDFVLPVGDDLRVFLNQEAITESLLRRLLRMRGVFTPLEDKADLIPFILLSFLTPDEFEELLTHVHRREDTSKERSTSHSVICDVESLGAILPNDINIHSIAADSFGNSKVIGTPVLTQEKIGEDDSYVLRFKVERTNITADWIRSRRIFEGSIRFTYYSQLKRLTVTTIHTSTETEKVNRLLARHVTSDLRDRQVIGKEPETRVTFGSFNNEERIRFFMIFTGLNESMGLKFDKLTDLALKLDETAGVPHDKLGWMKEKVSAVRLRGHGLHNTFFVTELECRPFVIFWKTICTFRFETADCTGGFTAVFEFADYATSGEDECEFQISIDHLSIDGRRGASLSDLTKRFTSKLTLEKESAYREIVDGRTAPKVIAEHKRPAKRRTGTAA